MKTAGRTFRPGGRRCHRRVRQRDVDRRGRIEGWISREAGRHAAHGLQRRDRDIDILHCCYIGRVGQRSETYRVETVQIESEHFRLTNAREAVAQRVGDVQNDGIIVGVRRQKRIGWKRGRPRWRLGS